VILLKFRGLEVIEEELKELEEYIYKNIGSPQQLISSTVKDLVSAGGKRIRPALTILMGRALGQKVDKLIPVAASMEIIHMATLVHDDIVDDAEVRRGRKTVQSKYGKDIAVFTGDYLFSRAFDIIAEHADRQSLKGFSKAVRRICEGEIEQYENRFSLDFSLLKYLRRISRKTGMLLALSCSVGAMNKKSNLKYLKSIGAFGMCLGLAYQITDDILDFIGDEKTLGKPAGGDMKQGVYTLPLIYAAGHSPDKDKLFEILKRKDCCSEEDLRRAIEIVKDSGGIEFSKSLADRYVAKGIKSIEFLKDSKYKRALEALIVNLNSREY